MGGNVDIRLPCRSPRSSLSSKDMKWSALKNVPFLWHLLRARLAELDGKFEMARARLNSRAAPAEYLALRDAYDARLASIAYAERVTLNWALEHPPEDLLRLIAQLQAHRWYRLPETKNERYAAQYLNYLRAVVLADATTRKALARELQESKAERLYKQTLLAT